VAGNHTPVKYEALQKNLDWYSEALSKTIRVTAIAIIAALWTIFTADEVNLGTTGLFGLPTETLVRSCFVFASATLLLDALQYIAAYWMTVIALDRYDTRASAGRKVKFYYDQENLGKSGLALYWSNFWLFPAKLIVAVAGGLSFFALAFAIQLGS
jgi:hypothetical protein